MKVEVKIPAGNIEQLIELHNEAVMSSQAEWVVLLNHDAYLACNPQWYELLIEGIQRAEAEENPVGFITCVARDRGDGFPQTADISKLYMNNTNIEQHEKAAKELKEKYGSQIKKIRSDKVASFFMCINKEAFKNVQFRRVRDEGGIGDSDHDFTRRMRRAGYSNYVMPGLYVYHRKHRSVKNKMKRK